MIRKFIEARSWESQSSWLGLRLGFGAGFSQSLQARNPSSVFEALEILSTLSTLKLLRDGPLSLDFSGNLPRLSSLRFNLLCDLVYDGATSAVSASVSGEHKSASLGAKSESGACSFVISD